MKYSFNLIITTIIMSIFSFSCNKKNSEVEAYACGTPEFKNKSESLKYSLDDAANIYYKYIFCELERDRTSFYANLIYNDNYIFGYLPYNLKTGVSSLDGAWVDGNTGEIKIVEEGKYLQLDISGIKPFRPIEVFQMTKEEYENIQNISVLDKSSDIE